MDGRLVAFYIKFNQDQIAQVENIMKGYRMISDPAAQGETSLLRSRCKP